MAASITSTPIHHTPKSLLCNGKQLDVTTDSGYGGRDSSSPISLVNEDNQPSEAAVEQENCILASDDSTQIKDGEHIAGKTHKQEVNLHSSEENLEHVFPNPSAIFSINHDIQAKTKCQTFCLTCHLLVSSATTTHEGHDLIDVDRALTNQKSEVQELLGATEQCLNHTFNRRKLLKTLHQDLVQKRKAIAVDLDNMFREVEHKLQERKMVLFTNLTDISYHRECYLDDQIHDMDSLESELMQLNERVNKVNGRIEDTDLLAYNCNELKEMADGLKTQTEKINSLKITENTFLKFSRSELPDIRRSLHTLGHVTGSNVIPNMCTASGDGLKMCQVNRQTTVKITLRNSRGQIERENGIPIEAELFKSDVSVECQCTDVGNGTYIVMYIAPEVGKYSLAIKLFGQHIKRSLFSVTAKPSCKITARGQSSSNGYQLTQIHEVKSNTAVKVIASPRISSPRSVCSGESFSSLQLLPISAAHAQSPPPQPPCGDYLNLIGEYGRKRGKFCNPQGVCVDREGKIHCSDSTNQNIQVFSESGGYLSHIENRGRQLGQLLRPIGLACTADNSIIFTDYENKCVNVFKNGQFVRRFGTAKLIGPKGVAISSKGTVLVADNKGNAVLEFTLKGRLVKKWGYDKNDKSKQLAGPHYIAVNKSGNIYVTDFHNHCVRVYDKEGCYLACFGQHGTGNGQFNAPTGITIDQEDNILVSDWGNSRIQVFDPSGSVLCHVNTSANPLFGPQSIHAIKENQVIVCDSGNHCLKVFRYM